MPSRYRRRRDRRYALPRQARLVISICALALIILCVVLFVRGCAGSAPDHAASGPPAASATPAAQSANDEGLGDGVPDDSVPPDNAPDDSAPDDAGSGDGEDALAGVGDEAVDLGADLQNAQEPTAPMGNRRAVIRSIGDIVMHAPLLQGAYDKGSKKYDFSSYFSAAASAMGGADYTVINVDGPLGGKKFASYRGYPQFNTPPQVLNALKECGVDMLTLANNHALDTYFDGLKGTVNNVEKVGLAHVGAYRTQEEYDAPKIVDISGIRVGFTNYTVSTNGMAKRSDPEASQYGLRMTANSNAPKDIRTLKDAGAEVVIAYMHWGEEYNRDVTSDIKKMATKLVAAGADVVIGGHQHVVLPCEWLTATDEAGQSRTGLVLYGMGNFLSDQRARYRDSGIIFEITLEDNLQTGKVEVLYPRFIPTYVQRTKGANSYEYRVLICGDVIEKRPAGMGDAVYQRVKQVWNEQKAIFEDGPAKIAKN